MKIFVRGKNVEITPEIEAYFEKKVSKLKSHFSALNSATAILSTLKNEKIVEVTLEGDNIVLRGEEKSFGDFMSAVDTVINRLDAQATKFKGKKYGRKKALSAKAKADLRESEIFDQDQLPGIVKIKSFNMKPLTMDEAIEQMELSHHNFFMFFNSENNKYSVVYKRSDSDYGIIEPA